MLYLIHDEQRKKIINSYYVSVWRSVSWMLLLVIIIAGVSAVPAIFLLKTEGQVSEGSVSILESYLKNDKKEESEAGVSKITNKINILQKINTTDVRKTYKDVQNIVESVSGIKIIQLSVDSVSKSVKIVTEVKDKKVAKELVDLLQKTSYKGADIPYSVLSEKASFIFAQNLTYE